MKSTKIRVIGEAKKIVDSVLGNNRKFYWRVVLFRERIFGDSQRETMGIIDGKYEDNYFVMSSMEKMGKIFSKSCEIRTPEKVG